MTTAANGGEWMRMVANGCDGLHTDSNHWQRGDCQGLTGWPNSYSTTHTSNCNSGKGVGYFISNGLDELSARGHAVALDSKIRHIVGGEGLGDTISNGEVILVGLFRRSVVRYQQDMLGIAQEPEVE